MNEPTGTNEPKRTHQLSMGITMSFTDHQGVEYPESFWIQDVVIRNSQKIAEVNDIGYKSIASFEAMEPPISPRDGGLIERIYRGAAFDSFIVQNALLIRDMAIAGRNHSKAILDLPSATGEMVSKFALASEIIMPDAMKGKK